MQQNGISRIFTHPKEEGEIIYDSEKSIHAFSWVAPWAYEIIHNCQYVELDCTFAILYPYVTSIPQFIVNGIAVPVGYIAGPQESSEFYSLYYSELQNVILAINCLHLLPVLSDEGKGLIKFCSYNNLTQFFCIRNIIGKIGAQSVWGKLIRRLLMAQTEEDFNNVQLKNMKFADGYYKENGKIPEKFLLHSFLEIKNNSVIKKRDLDSKYKSQISLFNRSFIASSSNHCEGFHRQLKKIAKEKKGLE